MTTQHLATDLVNVRLFAEALKRGLSMSYQPQIPVADTYIAALGRATYNFAYLEWGIVWLGETLNPGFLSTVYSLTAGQIAQKFESFVNDVPMNDPDQFRLVMLAGVFLDLVNRRNALIHGSPFTAVSGEQRLLYKGKNSSQEWKQDDIIDAAQLFETAAIEAVSLLHNGRLAAYDKAMGRTTPVF